MKVISYELKKIFNYKMVILIGVLLIVDICKVLLQLDYDIVVGSRRVLRDDSIYREVSEAVEGKISNETAKKIVSERQKYYDFIVQGGQYDEVSECYYSLYDTYKYEYEYASYAADIVKQASDNVSLFNNINNSKKISENRYICKVFSGRKIDNYYDSEDYGWLFKYDFSTLLILVFALVISTYFYHKERTSKTYTLLYLSGKRRNIYVNKLVVMSAVIFLVGVLLYITDFLVVGSELNLNGGSNPIYAIMKYSNSPLNVSIIGYYIFICLTRIFMCIVFSMLCVFVMSFLSGDIKPIVSGAALLLLFVLFGENIFKPNSFFIKPDMVYIFGHIFERYYMYMAGAILSFIILMYLNYKRFKKWG